MLADSVVAEVRAGREAYAARFGFDPVAMVRDLRVRERAGGRVVLPAPVAVGRQDIGQDIGGGRPNQALQQTGTATPVSGTS